MIYIPIQHKHTQLYINCWLLPRVESYENEVLKLLAEHLAMTIICFVAAATLLTTYAAATLRTASHKGLSILNDTWKRDFQHIF